MAILGGERMRCKGGRGAFGSCRRSSPFTRTNKVGRDTGNPHRTSGQHDWGTMDGWPTHLASPARRPARGRVYSTLSCAHHTIHGRTSHPWPLVRRILGKPGSHIDIGIDRNAWRVARYAVPNRVSMGRSLSCAPCHSCGLLPPENPIEQIYNHAQVSVSSC